MGGQRTPTELEAAGENETLSDEVRRTGAAIASSQGADRLAAVEWLIAALDVSNPSVRRAAAEALAAAYRRGDLDAAARQIILRHRGTIEAPHVDSASLDSFERWERAGGRYHADYPVHTDYGIGVALDPPVGRPREDGS